MKKITMLLFLVSAGTLTMAQQQQQQQQQKMKAAKVGFITNRLELSPGQAEKFWPLYNQFSDKRHNIQIERRMANMEMNKNGISDEEAKRMISQELKTRQDELDLESEFYEEIQDILSPTQTLKLIKAERDFNMEVLRNLQRRGGPNNQPKRRMPGN